MKLCLLAFLRPIYRKRAYETCTFGYARVSKSGDAQNLGLQYGALIAVGVAQKSIYEDLASGKNDSRPSLDACLKALRANGKRVLNA